MSSFYTIDIDTPQHIRDLQAQYGAALEAHDIARDQVHAISRKLQRAQHEHERNRVATFKRHTENSKGKV